jgi:hypothetical protein
MSDPHKIWIMSLLDKLVTYAYNTESGLVPLAILRGLQLTLKFGASDYSPASLGATGFILSMIGDYAGGRVYLDSALALLHTSSSKRVAARTIFVVHWFGMHWTMPIESCFKPLLSGYQIGMATGDTENAMWNIECYIDASFQTGAALQTVVDDCEVYAKLMRELKQETVLDSLLPIHQLALNLMGQSSHRVVLTGRALDEAQLRKRVTEKKTTPAIEQQIDRFKIMAAVLFGEYEIAFALTQQSLAKIDKMLPGAYGLCHACFYSALACISMALQTKQTKYKRAARRYARRIKQWAVHGNPNVNHLDSFLDAELAALSGQWTLAHTKYEQTTLLAGRRGLVHEHALSQERWAEACLRRADPEDALYHLHKASSLYEEWGAVAKVEQIRSKFADLLGGTGAGVSKGPFI